MHMEEAAKSKSKLQLNFYLLQIAGDCLRVLLAPAQRHPGRENWMRLGLPEKQEWAQFAIVCSGNLHFVAVHQ